MFVLLHEILGKAFLKTQTQHATANRGRTLLSIPASSAGAVQPENIALHAVCCTSSSTARSRTTMDTNLGWEARRHQGHASLASPFHA
eukprot:1313039-Pleurochrysis_carterae.AAC.2